MYGWRGGRWLVWGDGGRWGLPPVPDPAKPRPLTLHRLTARGPRMGCATHAYLTPDTALCDRPMGCARVLRGTWGVVGGLYPANPRRFSLSLIAACI